MKKNMIVGIAAMGMLSFGAISASAATGPAVDDSLITSKVKTAFFHELNLRTSHLHVNTNRGVVRLTGVVEKAPNVRTATELAGSIPGIVRVQNELVTVKQ